MTFAKPLKPNIGVHDDIRMVIAKAALNGGVVRSTVEAARIARAHLETRMTLGEIGGSIFKLAVETDWRSIQAARSNEDEGFAGR